MGHYSIQPLPLYLLYASSRVEVRRGPLQRQRESVRILASSAEGWCWASCGARLAGRRPLCHIIYFTSRGVEANEIQSQLLADLRPSAHSFECLPFIARTPRHHLSVASRPP